MPTRKTSFMNDYRCERYLARKSTNPMDASWFEWNISPLWTGLKNAIRFRPR